MKQLNTFEMESISGGYSWDFSSFSSAALSLVSNSVEAVASATVLGVLIGATGTLIGGTQSGANGGIIGLGLLGNLVGMFWGLAVGATMGVVMGAAIGWEDTIQLGLDGVQGAIAGTFVPWGN